MAQITFRYLHWLKGAPFTTLDQGEASQLTQWEQLTANNDLNIFQRFCIAMPVLM